MEEGGKTAAVRCTVLRVARPGKSGDSEEKTLGYCPPRSGLLEQKNAPEPRIGRILKTMVRGRRRVTLVVSDRPIEQQYDAAWVRARLPRVFAFTPELSGVEKSLLDAGFVAVAAGTSIGFPFVCTDNCGRTGLMFSSDGPDQDIQAKIAAAFWSLLLQSPDDLADFEATVYHPGAGVWMHFGCKNGEPSYDEFEEKGG
jgi:hypothetical protein